MSDVIEQLKTAIKPEEGCWYNTWYEEMAVGDFKCVDIVDQGDGRWNRHEDVIVLHVPTGDHYAFSQDIGLTEYQDDEVYGDNIWPVTKHVKVIEATEWVKTGE